MIPAHFRITRAFLLVAIGTTLAFTVIPSANAVERYTGRSRSEGVYKLPKGSSFTTQRLKKTDSIRASAVEPGDSLQMQKYRLQGDRNTATLRKRRGYLR